MLDWFLPHDGPTFQIGEYVQVYIIIVIDFSRKKKIGKLIKASGYKKENKNFIFHFFSFNFFASSRGQVGDWLIIDI